MSLSNQSVGASVHWLDALLVETPGPRLPCEYVHERLELIVSAAAGDAPHGEAVGNLASHVATCPVCWREYEDLYWVLQEMEQARLQEPAFYPSLDLSFLSDCSSHPAEERLAGLVRVAVGA